MSLSGGLPRRDSLPGAVARAARERHQARDRAPETPQDAGLSRSPEATTVIKDLKPVSDDPEMQKIYEDSVEATLDRYMKEELPDVSRDQETDLLLAVNTRLQDVRARRQSAVESGNASEAAAIGVEQGNLQTLLGTVADHGRLLAYRYSPSTLGSGFERSRNALEKWRGRSPIMDDLVGFAVDGLQNLGAEAGKSYQSDPRGYLSRAERLAGSLAQKSMEVFRANLKDENLAGRDLTEATKVLNAVQVELMRLEMLMVDVEHAITQKEQTSAVEVARDKARQAVGSAEAGEGTPEIKEADGELLDDMFKEGGISA